jgi:hypothetical protein
MRESVIVAGHGRVLAAKEIGLTEIPVIRIEHMSDDDRRAYVIADNKLADMAGWDATFSRSSFSTCRSRCQPAGSDRLRYRRG